jgi:A/G-specific adenine glycosylase
MKSEFTINLLKWHQTDNKRSMPWKGEKDPYRIWLSEIILQQTRVDQGLSYYMRFIEHFPTVQDLAASPQEKVFKLWEGLGYYTRCKNLHSAAQQIVDRFNGKFPSMFADILSLPGVGPYTASAIASFAFNQPYAVVDGNVSRVISRYFGINTPIDSSLGKRLYAELAASLLDNDQPGLYNQAIMDFGATICKPRNPICGSCVQQKECQAFQHNWVNSLPVKEKKLVRKERWFTYYIVKHGEHLYVRRRGEKDIWANLFEFILNESANSSEHSAASTSAIIGSILGTQDFLLQSISPFFKQQLTHQTIYGQFITVTVDHPLENKKYTLIHRKELRNYPFPKLINSYLEEQQTV